MLSMELQKRHLTIKRHVAVSSVLPVRGGGTVLAAGWGGGALPL